MKDACKIMLEPLTTAGRIRTGFGTSLLEEARAAGRGDRVVCAVIHTPLEAVFGRYQDPDFATDSVYHLSV